MHKKILHKFNNIEKKFDDDYVISKNSLYNLILNKKFTHQKLSTIGFIKNLILVVLSLITIFLCKIKRIKIANYFIVHKNSNNYDNRSKYILDNFNLKKSINIVRCQSLKESLKFYFFFPNVIFFMPIDYFNTFFLLKKKFLLENYKVIHKKELRNLKIFTVIFKFLKIKKFLSIDDQRVIQLFLKICKKLNISSYGYMHYKFSKYVPGIRYLCFDNFFVWSNFFKKKLIKVNKKYKYKKFFITGYPDKKNLRIKNKKVKILYLLDLDLNFKKTIFFLKKLNSNKKVELFLKFKPQYRMLSDWRAFCKNHNIKYFENESLDYINKIYNMDYFVATISTALLEATLYGAIPIKLMTSNDFADDMIEDKIVLKAHNFKDIKRIIKNNNKKNLKSFFIKVWGKKKYQAQNVKKILLKQFDQ